MQTLDPLEIPDLLANLVERSLVVFDDGTGRYHLPETMRAFAIEQLGADEPITRSKHLDYFSDCADLIDNYYQRMEDVRAGSVVHAELDNLRAAFEWGSVHNPARSLHIVAILGGVFFRLHPQEGKSLFERAMSLVPYTIDADHISLDIKFASICQTTDDFPRAGELLDRAFRGLEVIDNPYMRCFAMMRLVAQRSWEGVSGTGDDLTLQVLELAKANGLVRMEGQCYNFLGEGARERGDHDGAHRYYVQALEIIGGSPLLRPHTTDNVASNAIENNDLETAEKYYRDSLASNLQSGRSTFLNSFGIDGMGFVFLMRGDIEKAGLLMGFGSTRRAKHGITLMSTDAIIFKKMDSLGCERGGDLFLAAKERGKDLTYEQVVEIIGE